MEVNFADISNMKFLINFRLVVEAHLFLIEMLPQYSSKSGMGIQLSIQNERKNLYQNTGSGKKVKNEPSNQGMSQTGKFTSF